MNQPARRSTSSRIVTFIAALTAILLVAAGALAQTNTAPNSPAIVGGQEAAPGEFPWQVALIQNPANNAHDLYQKQYCGGTLIAADWVITAAHCVEGRTAGQIDIVAGIHNLYDPDPNYQRRSVQQIIKHEGWVDDNSYDNDVALLRLASPISERAASGATLPIKYLGLVPANIGDLAGANVTVSGWGNRKANPPGGATDYPHKLHKVTVPVVTNATCRASYGANAITDNMLCAGLAAGGKDSCQGDSGGPLVYNNGGAWQLAGIVSWGTGCAAPGYYGVYARVSRYPSWVYARIGTPVTPTKTPTPTSTPTSTPTRAPTSTSTPTKTPTGTLTPIAPTMTPTKTPTSTSTPTGTLTPMAPTPTATPGSPGAHAAYLPVVLRGPEILNGDFEAGPVAWQEESSQGWELIYHKDSLITLPHSGDWAAWLGGEHDEVSILSQQVTIPAASPVLVFYHWIGSDDVCGYDFAGVFVDGDLVKAYDLCKGTSIGDWQRQVVDLSSYAGRKVSIEFTVETDSSQNSNWFLDDVSLAATTLRNDERGAVSGAPGQYAEPKTRP